MSTTSSDFIVRPGARARAVRRPRGGAFLRFAVVAACLVCPPRGGDARADVDADWRGMFATAEEFAAIDEPVVCVLNIQHPDIIRKQLVDKPAKEYSGLKLREKINAQSGMRTVMVHYTEVDGEALERSIVKAVVITGRSKSISRETDARFHPFIRDTEMPILGLCGGMQLIGQAYGAKIKPLRELRDGEKDPHPTYFPGLYKEWGFLPVSIVKRDPLFAELPDEIVVNEAHAYQMTRVPEEFELLASSPDCAVQAFKHRERLVYGTQFHPEVTDDRHPDGRRVIGNFLHMAGLGDGRRPESLSGAAAVEAR